MALENFDDLHARLPGEPDARDYITVEVEVQELFLFHQCIGADINYWASGFVYGPGNAIFGARVCERQEWTDAGLDGEVGADTWHELDWSRAIKIAFKKYPWIFQEDRMDAETGDMWIQLAALGELRYG